MTTTAPWSLVRTVLCLVPAFGLGVVACGDAGPNDTGRTLTIYSSLPLQGDSRPQSLDIVRAMELALEQHGGRAGDTTIEYVSLDDATVEAARWDAYQVAANARTAAGDDTAVAYLGEFNSGASAISIPIINRAGLLQISPSNTYVGLTRSEGAEDGEPHVYHPTGERTYGRVVPADHIQAASLVAYMRDEGCTRVSILHDGEVYGTGIADQVERIAEGQQLQVLGNDGLGPASVLGELAGRVALAGADCFFFGGITQNGAVEVFQAVAAANPGIKMFGPDGLAESAFTEEVGPQLEAQIFLTAPTLDPGHYPASGQQFFEDFESRYGHAPEPYAIYGYEAMSVALLAIERAGDAATPDAAGRAAVVQQFFAIEDRDSVLGTYSIDENGDTTLTSYGGYVVENGAVTFHHVITAT